MIGGYKNLQGYRTFGKPMLAFVLISNKLEHKYFLFLVTTFLD